LRSVANVTVLQLFNTVL